MLKLLGFKVKRGIRYIVNTLLLFVVWTYLLRMEIGSSALIQFAPILVVIGLGLYAGLSTLYNVATIRDCPEDSESLDKEIIEARADLESKGFKFT